MTLATNTGFAAAADAPVFGELMLVELQFRAGSARLTTWPTDVQAMGERWTGIGSLGRVGDLHESEDGAEEKLDLILSGADDALLGAAMGNPADYQDRPVRIWLALLDAQTLQITGAPVLRFSGVMDQPAVSRERGEIVMHCRTASYDVRSNPAGLRYTQAQHQAVHPGERGFEYVESLIADTTVWMSVKFQASRA